MTRTKTPSPAACLHEQTVRHHCRALKMPTVAGQFETLAQAAIREGHGHVQYLDALLTAEIGLVSYTLLILTRHIVAGLDAVPRDIVEAADGMGFTAGQRLLRVDLPLAMPLIVAGLRIATVTTIGLVMVTALIGEGGLGNLMLRGFNFRNYTAVYVGAIVTVGLALVADAAILALGRIATPWTRRR